jgi:hypothetical protein
MLSSVAFDSIDRSASADSIRVWAAEEEHARKERMRDIKVMDIYDIRMERREFDPPALVLSDNRLQSLLGQKYSLN